MTDVMSYILRRRSIRAYAEREVERETLVLLLQAAMAAPTACNSQPWEFVVVTEREIMDQLRANLFFGRYNAPAAIVVCGNPSIAHNSAGRTYWVQDCAAATENILLAAAGLGLGAVWIGAYPHDSVIKKVAGVLGISEHVTPLSIVYVGYPAVEVPPRSQYDERRVYWQHYEPRKRRAKLKNAKHR